MKNPSRRLGDSDARLLKGYAPLVAIVSAFLLMTLLVPTVAREREIVSPAATGGPAGAGGTGAAAGADATVPTGVNGGRSSGGGGGPGGALPTATGPCHDRPQQVPGDAYSPPCVAFSGDNGGATSQGVTGDKIVVAYRVTADPNLQATISKLASQYGDANLVDSPEDVKRTLAGLVDYFNTRFQFYGRKIQLAPYQGQGQLTQELLGGGQEAANADAIKVGSELHAFADVSALSQPYADALSRQHVLNFGAPYMSQQWFAARRPYSWSLAPDCTTVAEVAADYSNKRLLGRAARWAGGSLQGKPRRVAIIAPDNAEYQQCEDTSVKLIRAAGHEVADRISYTLDLASLSSQAASIVAKLKNDQITTVACACDPILPVFLTSKAAQQGYVPEWGVVGTALTDTDIVGQLYDQTEWAHAFGGSALGTQVPERASLAYAAYKSVRSDEPAHTVQLLYYQMYMAAIGIQMAGPRLTPGSFEQGMFAYPGGTGEAGTWGFPTGTYTPQRDAMEIWWDPNRVSAYNGKRGAYVQATPRYRVGQWPAAEPNVFTSSPGGAGGG
jgi:hypothetical protein